MPPTKPAEPDTPAREIVPLRHRIVTNLPGYRVVSEVDERSLSVTVEQVRDDPAIAEPTRA